MNRRTLPQLARVIAIAALVRGYAVRPPPSSRSIRRAEAQRAGADRDPRGPLHDAQEQEFNYDVENFIKYGLLADDFYKEHAASIRHRLVFR